jgi:glycosyltransferase involved in cell wall biosynthesis
MLRLPVMNDPARPLFSILVYNYDGRHLRACLESIVGQSVLDNIEVIVIDDGTQDASWETALEFSRVHDGIVTVVRNRRIRGPEYNLENATRMAKGKFCVPLTDDQAFLPDYVRQCATALDADSTARFDSVFGRLTLDAERPSVTAKPLVSILVFNYNYGRYLRQCLESAFTQTYDNIEVCFSDNASSDESWAIALEYAAKYPGSMTLTRNRQNFGSHANFNNCLYNAKGRYYVELCSDDALKPEMVERCVEVLEATPSAGFAMVHRTIMDEHGRTTEEPPFYNRSCVIPGPDQAAVYMVAAVNPCISQVMYRRAATKGKGGSESPAGRWYGTRLQDFRISCEYPMAYIKDPLLLHRVHSQSDAAQAAQNLIEIIGPFVLANEYSEIASQFNLENVSRRLPEAVTKLAQLSLRYAVRALAQGDEVCAEKYWHLSFALAPPSPNDRTAAALRDYMSADPQRKKEILQALTGAANVVTRSVSYDPPPSAVPHPIGSASLAARRS